MKTCLAMACLLTALLLTACVDNSTTLVLNKDGSGTLIIRELFSPELAATIPELAGWYDEGAPRTFFEGVVRRKTEQLGPDVRLVFTREMSNARGWKGYQARYAFQDINRVRVITGDLLGDDGTRFGGFAFEFEAGETSALRVIPLPPEETLPVETLEAARDLRVAFQIRVAGEIIGIDERYATEDTPSAVTLVDLQANRVLGNADSKDALADTDGTVAEIYALDLPDMTLCNPFETFTIEF